MLRKNFKFRWSEEAEKAFDEIKRLMASHFILKTPDFHLTFFLACDASDKAIVACLFQVVNDLEHPICFIIQKLNKHQLAYSLWKRGLQFACIAVARFRIYFGTAEITVDTDRNPLCYFHKMSQSNNKLMRWKLQLMDYNIAIKHRPGKQNILQDILSRPAK